MKCALCALLALPGSLPAVAIASSSIYAPPESVIVMQPHGLLVATVDRDHDRWRSLCWDGPNGAIEIDVHGLDHYGPLFGSRLHMEGSAGFKSRDQFRKEFQPLLDPPSATSAAQPANAPGVETTDDETVVIDELHSLSARSLEFTTSAPRPGETGNDYWRIRVVVWFVDGHLHPFADVEAMPTDREGMAADNSRVQRSQLEVAWRPRSRCGLPDPLQRRASPE